MSVLRPVFSRPGLKGSLLVLFFLLGFYVFLFSAAFMHSSASCLDFAVFPAGTGEGSGDDSLIGHYMTIRVDVLYIFIQPRSF